MRKGFTLVELLAIIAILSILMLLIIPTMIGILNKSKQEAYDMQVSQIKTAAKLYISDKKSSIIEFRTIGGTYDITLEQLNTEGYIETPIINPLTDNQFNVTTAYVRVVREAQNKYVYSFYGQDS